MIRSFFRLGFVAASSVVALLFLAEPSAASAATYDVDITADAPNRNQCTAAPGDCSLRGAIDKATTTPGTHTINVPNGTYTLSSVSGDLIVSKSMTIRGAGGTVIIQAATSPGVATNRVLRVASGTLTLANVEIRHGASVDGAGIHIQAGAALVGTRVLVQANQALGGGLGVNSTGGGIRTLGSLTLRRSAIVSNGARIGGGLAVESGGSASLFNTTVSNNYREWGDDASGINVRPGGSASLDGVTVYQNHALALAGQGESGIHAGGQVTIKNSIVAFNDNPLGIVNCYGNIVSLGNNLSDSTDCPFTTGVNGDEEGVPVSLGALQTFSPQVRGHLPLAGSKAIDTATYAGAACQALDQRNSARPQDGNGDGQAICDKGAIERKSTD